MVIVAAPEFTVVKLIPFPAIIEVITLLFTQFLVANISVFNSNSPEVPRFNVLLSAVPNIL